MSVPKLEVCLATTTLAEVRRQFGNAPTREHVSLTPTNGTTWFLWTLPTKFVGFGALMRVTPSRARLKALWVLPSERGKGWGVQGARLLCEEAEARGYSELDQYAISPQWWIDRGWLPMAAPRPNGAQRLSASLPLPRRL